MESYYNPEYSNNLLKYDTCTIGVHSVDVTRYGARVVVLKYSHDTVCVWIG